ncbi:PalH/RIM21-domain-containing protein [Coniella lustricola]|uniref:PalH/RIM21-domain-containing protein n=1 Tax=Coniella lustricola TaxID=2025994 RepID=A0A2T2ZT53_9PEZI|nr:PalH/RIM21-domain-containing protein [Coniella lustricola]
MSLTSLIPTAASVLSALPSSCSPFSLPAGAVIDVAGKSPVTLSQAAVFTPTCAPTTTIHTVPIIINSGLEVDETAHDTESANFQVRDPFYASTFPQCYALAATTVVAYTLVIMLFITPRSFLDGGVVMLGRSGFTTGGGGSQSIGGRPWLQKMAATFVAVSLTIATVDTFRVAEQQYTGGIQNASVMQADVLGSTELKVIKIISEAFLWLAQAQTLIRLFPRHREKVIIKWTAFALIAFGVLFDSLDSFMYTTAGATRPRSFTDAIPALSYLFQLSLGVLYAAWVVYYSLMKKHYAYYHPQMRNIGLVALLSVTAVLVPIVFFILDICKPDFTGWGDYVRWVGAAAASVIVWEWVERIEALEREEKKDGILGREVFDGDEMLGLSASDYSWPRKRKNTKRDDDDDMDGGEIGFAQARAVPAIESKSGPWPLVSSLASRYRQRSRSRPREDDDDAAGGGGTGSRQNARGDRVGALRFWQPPLWPTRPPPAATPISRTETASAASTVYAMRYQPLSMDGVSTTIQEPSVTPSQSASQVAGHTAARTVGSNVNAVNTSISGSNRPPGSNLPVQMTRLPSRNNITATDFTTTKSNDSSTPNSRRNFKSRFEDFAAIQAEKLRDRIKPEVDTNALPVKVIPAPPRRGAALRELRAEQAAEQQQQRQHQPQQPNMLAPRSLQRQVSSENTLGTTVTDLGSPISPRLWHTHSAEGSDQVSPITSLSSSGSGH